MIVENNTLIYEKSFSKVKLYLIVDRLLLHFFRIFLFNVVYFLLLEDEQGGRARDRRAARPLHPGKLPEVRVRLGRDARDGLLQVSVTTTAL